MYGRYFEHDDPGPSTSKPNYRNNVFIMGRHKDKKYRNSGFPGGKPRNLDLDGDVDMNAPVDRRFNPYSQKMHNNKRKGGKKGKGKHDHWPRHGDGIDVHSWYKVSIPHGKKFGKAFIMKSIASMCKLPCAVTPYNFQFNKQNAEFYVNSHCIASAIREVSRQVTTPDGFKMMLFVSSCSSPVPYIDPVVVDAIKNCMSPCYDPVKHSLNLMKFHHVPAFKVHGFYLPLSRSVVFSAVVEIIKENIPELEILLLNDNKLYSLEAASSLTDCKHLKSINLRCNKLRSMIELNHLKGLDLEELILDGNPLCDDFRDKSSYISAVRERFPKLKRLDGHELPPSIGFDLGTETVPVSKKSFFAEEVKDLVIKFLYLYYSIYDSGDRSRLLDAYHDQAAFSLCLSKHTQKTNRGTLVAYAVDNRNLLSVNDSSERFKLLKQGKLSVVNALQELPQTMHDLLSFSVDIFHVSPGLASFSVIGVFKEVGAEINTTTLKTFSRTFVVVPLNQGFVIINEMLFIAHAGREQQEKAFKRPAPTPSPSPAPPADDKSTVEKQMEQLVMELSKQTGMNNSFSTKCLEENEWDYQRAFAVFMKFKTEGKLPPEAFLPG